MKKILCLLFFVLLMALSNNAFADKFWVGGTGNSNDPTNHWATTSGGSPGAGNAPTAADNCFFNASSGAGTATINAALACRSLQSSGSSITTVVHNSATTITLGDATAPSGGIALDLSGFTTYTLGDVATSAYAFNSTNVNAQTINPGGKTLANMTFTGANQDYVFIGNLTTGATATMTYTAGASGQIHFDGASDISGLTHSIGKFSSNNSNVRTIALGNAAIAITGTVTVWDAGTSSNLTLTQGSSGSITTSGNAATAKWGGLNCVYKNITQNIGTGTETNGGTFVGTGGGGATIVNLTITSTGGPDDRVAFAGSGTTNSLTITGSFTVTGATSASARITFWPDSQANVRTVTVSGATMNWSYVDIQDIHFISSTNIDFSTVTGNGAVGDAGGNSITGGGTLTFLPSTSQHWVSASGGNTSTLANWTSRLPLAQDNIFFDNAFSASQTITCDRKWVGHNMDWTGATGSPTFQGSGVTSSERYITGSFVGKSGVTWKGNSSEWFLSVRSAQTYTDNGITKSSISKITIQAGNGGSFTWAATASMGGPVRFYGGTIDFGNQSLTMQSIEIGSNNAGNATIWNMGSGTLNLNGTGNILFPTISKATNWAQTTVNPGTSTILISNTSVSTKTFQGGDKTYYNLSISGTGSGAVIFNDSNSFQSLPKIIGGTKTLTFTVGTTQTILGTGNDNFGNGSNVITINSSSGGSAATISKASGLVNANFLSLTDSTATGGAQFFAGENSTFVSGNTGWLLRTYYFDNVLLGNVYP